MGGGAGVQLVEALIPMPPSLPPGLPCASPRGPEASPMAKGAPHRHGNGQEAPRLPAGPREGPMLDAGGRKPAETEVVGGTFWAFSTGKPLQAQASPQRWVW